MAGPRPLSRISDQSLHLEASMSRFQSTCAAATLLAALMLPVAAGAQSSASQNLTVEATVIKALTLTKVTAGNLSYGLLAQGSTETIAATAAGAIKFKANGEVSTAISLTFASATLSNGANTMTFTPAVNALNTDTQGSSSAVTSGSSVTLHATTGDYYVWVGGSITAAAAQATGAYSGTFTLSVAYTGV
jgi:hypothetical protein